MYGVCVFVCVCVNSYGQPHSYAKKHGIVWQIDLQQCLSCAVCILYNSSAVCILYNSGQFRTHARVYCTQCVGHTRTEHHKQAEANFKAGLDSRMHRSWPCG
jgi:hypothetical protein